MRKKLNQPHQDRINQNNDEAREFTDILKHVQQIAMQKCESYQKLLEQKKQEEIQKIEEAREIFGTDDALVAPHLPPPMRLKAASLVTRTVRNFRIVDKEKVPKKYWIIDEEAIKQDLKLGLNEIPGIEVYEQQVSQMRTR
jgi:hypothetical protein